MTSVDLDSADGEKRAALRGMTAWRVSIAAAAFASAIIGLLFPLEQMLPRAELLAHFAPLAAGFAIVILLASTLMRASALVLVFALIGVLGPGLLAAPEYVAAATLSRGAPEDAPRLKLVSANVWSQNHDQRAFEAFIRREQPDIIVVQEAWGPARAALERLAPEYHIHAGCRWDSDCNVVILSRFALTETLTPWTGAMAAVRLQLPERLGGRPVEVMAVHLARPSSLEMERRQHAAIVAATPSFSERALVAGDFNATPWSRVMRDFDRALPLERRTRALPTWPSPSRRFTRFGVRMPSAVLPIDHVYAGRAWRTVEIRRGPDIGSDHYPLIATFALTNDRERRR